MLDRDSLLAQLPARLGALPPGACLDLRTFKRNRSVRIVRDEGDSYAVMEDGFHKELWEALSRKDVLRLMEVLLKREFPRSHKIRCYTLDSASAADVNRMGYGAGRFGKGGG